LEPLVNGYECGPSGLRLAFDMMMVFYGILLLFQFLSNTFLQNNSNCKLNLQFISSQLQILPNAPRQIY
jgi:hypothetical protein